MLWPTPIEDAAESKAAALGQWKAQRLEGGPAFRGGSSACCCIGQGGVSCCEEGQGT